jgi:hypothetical protein
MRTRISLENLKVIDRIRDLDVYERIILKMVLKETVC